MLSKFAIVLVSAGALMLLGSYRRRPPMMGSVPQRFQGLVLRELTDRDRGQPAFWPCCRRAPHLRQCEGTADPESGRPISVS